MTVMIEYANIAPDILVARLFTELSCPINWTDVDEDYFAVVVFSDSPWVLQRAKNILAKYV